MTLCSTPTCSECELELEYLRAENRRLRTYLTASLRDIQASSLAFARAELALSRALDTPK